MAHKSNAESASQAAEITQVEAQNTNVAAESQTEEIFQGVLNAENKTADIVELRPLQRVLHTIVGLTWTQCLDVATDGYEYCM